MVDYMDGVLEASPWRDILFRRIAGHFVRRSSFPFAGAYYRFQGVFKQHVVTT